MALPNPTTPFDPLTTLPAESLNDMQENIQALADGTVFSSLIHRFSGHRSSAFSLTASATVVIPFNSKQYDVGSNLDIATNVGRFTATVAGLYHFDAAVRIAGAGSTILWATLYKNGAIAKGGAQFGASLVGSNVAVGVTGDIQLAVGDYVDVRVYCNGAAPLDVTPPSYPYNYFNGHLVVRA